MSNILKGPFFWLCFFVIRYVSKAYITDNKGYVVWTTAIRGLMKEGLGKRYKRIIVEQVEAEGKKPRNQKVSNGKGSSRYVIVKMSKSELKWNSVELIQSVNFFFSSSSADGCDY